MKTAYQVFHMLRLFLYVCLNAVDFDALNR